MSILYKLYELYDENRNIQYILLITVKATIYSIFDEEDSISQILEFITINLDFKPFSLGFVLAV